MKCPRIYATADGESHFCEADIASTWTPLFASEAAFGVSAHYPASHIRFGHVPSGVREPAGARRRVGCSRYGSTASSNSKRAMERCRRASAGDYVLVEDTHGEGHISRHPAEGQNVILISVPNGLNPPSS